jgi:hypothetical protein
MPRIRPQERNHPIKSARTARKRSVSALTRTWGSGISTIFARFLSLSVPCCRSAVADPLSRKHPVTDDRHGPLPLLLLVLTMVTGLVDVLIYLKLGHVFVADMIGNVVFLGFALPMPRIFRF